MRKMQAESLAELVRMASKLELPPAKSSLLFRPFRDPGGYYPPYTKA